MPVRCDFWVGGEEAEEEVGTVAGHVEDEDLFWLGWRHFGLESRIR